MKMYYDPLLQIFNSATTINYRGSSNGFDSFITSFKSTNDRKEK